MAKTIGQEKTSITWRSVNQGPFFDGVSIGCRYHFEIIAVK